MALSDVNSVCIQYTEEKGLFIYKNETTYGGVNEDRNESAEILIGAHVAEDTTESFVTIDSAPVLTKLEYEINNTIDGHYRFERLRFPNYNAGTANVKEVKDVNDITTTYPTLIYYSVTGLFYKCIENVTGTAPDAVDGTTYWEVITDFTLDVIRNNDKIEIFVDEILYDARGRICVKNELYKLSAKGCGCIDDVSKLLPYLKKKIYLAGARAKADDAKPEEAEVITRVLQKLCPC